MNPLRTALPLAVLAAFLGPSPLARATVVPGPNVNVSNQGGAQSEVGVAVNPTNPLNLIAVSNNISDLTRLGAWYSFDGGATWMPNFIDENEDGFSGGDRRFDPNVAFDSDGNAYVVYSTRDSGNRLLVATSTDGGQSYTQVATVTTDPGPNNLHTAMITTRSDPGTDGVLVVWAHVQAGGESIEAALSVDGGASFPTQNSMVNDALQRTFLPWAAANASGDFEVVWEVNAGSGAGSIFHDWLDGTTLASGADTNVTSVQITDFGEPTSAIPPQPDRGVFSVATVDVDRTTGRIYLSYTDRPSTASNDTDIYLRYSDDGGANWSARIQINDDATTTSQFLPRMAVDQTTGTVVVVWYDARNDPVNDGQADVFASDSTDGGLTWSANRRVTTAPSDESTGNAARDGNNYGEYIGLTAVGGVAYAAWTDARAANFTAGTREDVYTAILASGPVADAGDDQTVECTLGGTEVMLDGSGSIGAGVPEITFTWEGDFLEGGGMVSGVQADVTFDALGIHPVELTVDDPLTDSDSDVVQITIEDTTDPTITAPDDVVLECTSPDGAPADLGTPVASDSCDPSVDVTEDAPDVLPLGMTLVTWTATDDSGNSASDTQLATVVDTTPPTIESLEASPDSLWPPNHKLVPVTVTAVATDVCDAMPTCAIVSVSSDEPVNGGGDGNTAPDWTITGDLTVDLRSERSGKGDGRDYEITVQCSDASGNTAEASTHVVVGHDRRH